MSGALADRNADLTLIAANAARVERGRRATIEVFLKSVATVQRVDVIQQQVTDAFDAVQVAAEAGDFKKAGGLMKRALIRRDEAMALAMSEIDAQVGAPSIDSPIERMLR